MADGVTRIADAVTQAGDTGATLRIATVTAVVGAHVRLDVTGTALVAVDADVSGLEVGQRVYAMQQGPVTVVSGRLTGAPPPAVPVGALTLYAGLSTAVPAGYLLANGASLLRAEWPALFAVLGTTYGAADATRFSLPNLVNRVPLGAGTRGLGTTGGAERVTLTDAQMPSHSHPFTGAAHNHTQDPHTHSVPSSTDQVAQSGSGVSVSGTATSTTGSTTAANNSATAGGTVGTTGSDTSHENMQPWVALYYMIRAD